MIDVTVVDLQTVFQDTPTTTTTPVNELSIESYSQVGSVSGNLTRVVLTSGIEMHITETPTQLATLISGA